MQTITWLVPRPWLVGLAWVAMLLMSRLPQIVLNEFFAIETSFVGTWLAVALALLAVTWFWPALRPLRGYLWIMLITALVTGPLDTLLRTSNLWAIWFGQGQGWAIRFLGERLPLLIEALLLMLVLIPMGRKRQDFFLATGELRAPAVGLRVPGMGNAWLFVGPFLALLLTIFFFFGMMAQSGASLSRLVGVLPWLPAILLFAVMNAFGEEMIYRAAPLSQLWPVVGARHAIWLTAVWFGLGHYYGGIPNGAVGALLSGGIALLYGKAMLETRGLLLPTLMHLLTDVAIYIFLALAAVNV
jgi:membrane protease YdiL (CAAX protease family)